MKTLGMVTLIAAHQHLIASASPKAGNGVKLAELQTLCIPVDPKREKKRQRWSFKGDWNKSVRPYYA